MRKINIALLFILIAGNTLAQRYPNTDIKVEVKPLSEVFVWFDRPLQEWDGFGINYVEACQTRNYNAFPQDYSGFSFANAETKETILKMIFGKDGLKPGLTKLFLDPFHEGADKHKNDNDDPMVINMAGFDHTTTTRWMRYFNREGIKRMKEWGGKLTAITTLYSPAPWMTRQKYILGRDLDPDEKYEVAEYMVSWTKYLIEEEQIDVKYISFHNEGDAYYRWPLDGSNPGEDHRDYNMYWPPSQVVDYLKITRKVLDANGMSKVGLTPGETQTWFRFDNWGYASEIANDPEALNNLDLITSHSFAFLDDPNSVYYGDYRSVGQDLIRQYKPDIKTWVTSRPWGNGTDFIENIRRDIYECKANGLIPWALISGANQWMDSKGKYTDGSMNAAFLIKADGTLKINPQYYFYKQVSRAGQPGMSVAQVASLDPSLGVIAFAANGTQNPNSFVLINKSDQNKTVTVKTGQTTSKSFETYITTESGKEYEYYGEIPLVDNTLEINIPNRSVLTFFGR